MQDDRNNGEEREGFSVHDMTADRQFYDFFTTSVIEVPEEMRKVVAPVEADPEKKHSGFGSWLRGRQQTNAASAEPESEEEAAEPEEGEVLRPAAPEAAPELTLSDVPDLDTDVPTVEQLLAQIRTMEGAVCETVPMPVFTPQAVETAAQAPAPAAAPEAAQSAADRPAQASEAPAAPAEQPAAEPVTPAPAEPEAITPAAPAPAEEAQPAPAVIVEPAEPAETAAATPEAAQPAAEPVRAAQRSADMWTAGTVSAAAMPSFAGTQSSGSSAADDLLRTIARTSAGKPAAAPAESAAAPAQTPAAAEEPAAEPEVLIPAVNAAEEEPEVFIPVGNAAAEAADEPAAEEKPAEAPAAAEEPEVLIPAAAEEEPEAARESEPAEVVIEPSDYNDAEPADEAPTGEILLFPGQMTDTIPVPPAEPAEPAEAEEETIPFDESFDSMVGEAGTDYAGTDTLSVSEEEAAKAAVNASADSEETSEAGEKPNPLAGIAAAFAGIAARFSGSGSDDSGEAAEAQSDEAQTAAEYNSPDDAETVRTSLTDALNRDVVPLAGSGVLAAVLFVLNLLGPAAMPDAGSVSGTVLYVLLNILLLAAGGAVSLPLIKNGLEALKPGSASHSVRALPAAVYCAAALQAVVCLVFASDFESRGCTMAGGLALLFLFLTRLSEYLSLRAEKAGFEAMLSIGSPRTAYRLQNTSLLQTLCSGMDEDEPVLLLSRPDTLLKDFIRQSEAPHYTDRRAVDVARLVCIAAALGAVITLARTQSLAAAFSVLALLPAMSAPVSAVLLRSLPGVIMQKNAEKAGAAIPGWPGVSQLGNVDMLQVDASDLFPSVCAHLYGIKPLRKERLDNAILYAASILITGCDTLSGLFRSMIENRTDMLYPIKDLEFRRGLGYVAWCDSSRVLLGTRDMMEEEGIPLPARDYEDRYTQNGARQLLYLAVSGRLYAMFLFGYKGTKKIARALNVLKRENIRLLVTAQDPTLTAARIGEIYRLRPGFVKVLDEYEVKELAPAVANLPVTEGCMVHSSSVTGLVGGLQAAAGAERGERSGWTVVMISAGIAALISLLLSIASGMAAMSALPILLYQIAWTALSLGVALTRK